METKLHERSSFSVFELKPVGWLSPGLQLSLIVVLFVISTALTYGNFLETGTMHGYPVSATLLFAPIYEEILFRGLIMIWLTRRFSFRASALLCCLLFGIWHLKNIFYLPPIRLTIQIVYATLGVGPFLLWLTKKTESIWPGVIAHYVNNIWAFSITPIIVKTLFR